MQTWKLSHRTILEPLPLGVSTVTDLHPLPTLYLISCSVLPGARKKETKQPSQSMWKPQPQRLKAGDPRGGLGGKVPMDKAATAPSSARPASPQQVQSPKPWQLCPICPSSARLRGTAVFCSNGLRDLHLHFLSRVVGSEAPRSPEPLPRQVGDGGHS